MTGRERARAEELRAARRAAVIRSAELGRYADQVACASLPASLRVALLVELAYRAVIAAESVAVTAGVPRAGVEAVSPRPVAARLLLAGWSSAAQHVRVVWVPVRAGGPGGVLRAGTVCPGDGVGVAAGD